jgi:hypothetical protein
MQALSSLLPNLPYSLCAADPGWSLVSQAALCNKTLATGAQLFTIGNGGNGYKVTSTKFYASVSATM